MLQSVEHGGLVVICRTGGEAGKVGQWWQQRESAPCPVAWKSCRCRGFSTGLAPPDCLEDLLLSPCLRWLLSSWYCRTCCWRSKRRWQPCQSCPCTVRTCCWRQTGQKRDRKRSSWQESYARWRAACWSCRGCYKTSRLTSRWGATCFESWHM